MAQDNCLFEFSEPTGALAACQPGQFVELWVPGAGECPISVCSGRVGDKIQLMIRRAGRVTKALFQMKEGDWVGLRGPYGHGFPCEIYKHKNVCMIAGGLGVAPIRSLWQHLLDHREEYGNLILIYGMRHSDDLLFRSEFKQLLRRHDINVYLAAEDVTTCEVPPGAIQAGRVTDMVAMAPLTEDYEIAVCGPPIMYQFVLKELQKKAIPEEQIWLSLERQMKCGVGKCGHCFIGGRSTCQSGPVFQVSDLKLMSEVIECGNGHD